MSACPIIFLNVCHSYSFMENIEEIAENTADNIISERDRSVILRNVHNNFNKFGRYEISVEDLEVIIGYAHQYVLENQTRDNYFILDLKNLEISAFAMERSERKLSGSEIIVPLPSDLSYKY